MFHVHEQYNLFNYFSIPMSYTIKDLKDDLILKTSQGMMAIITPETIKELSGSNYSFKVIKKLRNEMKSLVFNYNKYTNTWEVTSRLSVEEAPEIETSSVEEEDWPTCVSCNHDHQMLEDEFICQYKRCWRDMLISRLLVAVTVGTIVYAIIKSTS